MHAAAARAGRPVCGAPLAKSVQPGRIMIRDLISNAVRCFRDAGITDARHDAIALMMMVTGYSRTQLILSENAKLDPLRAAEFETFVRRRINREPLQHITGKAEFYGITLACDRRALVPRADSETLVDVALARIPEMARWLIADLGTGSGALLAAVLAMRPLAAGLAIEVSPDASALARENFARAGVLDRVTLVTTCWISEPNWLGADLVLANPPYIPTGDIDALEPEVRDHDPLNALDGGEDGLRAYREITRRAEAMRPGCWLVFEVGTGQSDAVVRLLAQSGFEDLCKVRDLGGVERCVCGRRPA